MCCVFVRVHSYSCPVTECVAEVIFAVYVSHNVWPLGKEKEQELADCIDLEHLHLLFLKCSTGGPARFTSANLFI